MSLLAKTFSFFVLTTICVARDTAISYVPVVMLGYDVVAYHYNVSGCDSIMGNKNYSYQLISADGNGIDRVYEFWFADQNNLNIFAGHPWQYVPRFGGFCRFCFFFFFVFMIFVFVIFFNKCNNSVLVLVVRENRNGHGQHYIMVLQRVQIRKLADLEYIVMDIYISTLIKTTIIDSFLMTKILN